MNIVKRFNHEFHEWSRIEAKPILLYFPHSCIFVKFVVQILYIFSLFLKTAICVAAQNPSLSATAKAYTTL